MIYQRRKEGTTEEWADMAPGTFPACMLAGHEYRIKPEPAAPKWPKTTMVNRQINDAIANGPLELVSFGATETARRVINKAIEHECSTGAFVPADKVREIEAKARAEGEKTSKERDLEVARAVDKWYSDTIPYKSQNSDSYLLDIVRGIPK